MLGHTSRLDSMEQVMTFPIRELGKGGPAVSALGIGCMGMSEFYGRADPASALATIAAALEAGITLFDTGDFYGMGHNEVLLAEGIRGRRDKAFIQVKSGALRGPDGSFLGIDARPVALKNALAYSLQRLKTDYIDLYMTGLDPAVPIEDTIGAMGELVGQGYVRYVGLTNVDADTLRRAHSAHPITALQHEYGLMSRDMEKEVLPACRELGIGITAYGILSRGLLTGSKGNGDGDVRSQFYPRFQGENLSKNELLAAALSQAAEREGITAAQAAISWVLSQGDDIIPLIGTRTVDRLSEALAAPMRLSPASMAAIEEAVPLEAVHGDRFMVH
jgi:aryl-alcohol dehydrogenase-like predicted oxidoreductase